MKFRSIPPDPSEFPRLGLVGPPLVPLAIIGIAWLAERAGHRWNIHGDAIGMFMVFVVCAGVAFISSTALLFSGALALRNHRSLRTGANFASLGVAALYVIAAIAGAIYFYTAVNAT